MGFPCRKLYATCIEDSMFVTAGWKPEKKEGRWFMPKDTPIGLDFWVPNVLNLTEDEGPVEVKIVPSEEITGIWLVCFDDYFGNEQHVYNFKPRFKEGTAKLDYTYQNEMEMNEEENFWGLHVATQIDMKAGDGPVPVTFERGWIEDSTSKKRKLD